MVQGAFDKALAILREERDALEEGAKQLLDKETLGEAELQALYNRIDQKHSAASKGTRSEEHGI
jgi:ATP-dependent Zn protease